MFLCTCKFLPLAEWMFHHYDKCLKLCMNSYMVGDNPASDIAGANAHGWSSILVRTGVFHDTHGEKPAYQPTAIADNVEKGVEWAIGKEMGLF